MKLGEILIQLGMLTPEQLKAALSERDLFGGRLGTQLVERGILDPDQVSEALSRQMRVPAALRRHFEKADPAVVALLRPNLAARYMAIPLVAARSGPRRIVVATATPEDVLVVDDVSFALGARVEPMVASELAIVRNLHRFYNIDVNLHRAAPPEPAHPGTRVGATPGILARTPVGRPPSLSLLDPGPAVATLAPPPGTVVTIEDALHRLSVAEHREQIADILIDFMLPRFDCGLLFLLRGTNAQVWRGFAADADARAVESISFPLSVPSLFRNAVQRKVSFRGLPPAEGRNLHAQIWGALGCATPTDMVVIPMAIGERVVSLAYAHTTTAAGMPDTHVHDLQAMCSAVSSSFIRLIQKAREEDQL